MYIDKMANAFADEIEKIADAKAEAAKAAGGLKKHLVPMAIGGAAALGLHRANEDRRIGKQVRKQQQY